MTDEQFERMLNEFSQMKDQFSQVKDEISEMKVEFSVMKDLQKKLLDKYTEMFQIQLEVQNYMHRLADEMTTVKADVAIVKEKIANYEYISNKVIEHDQEIFYMKRRYRGDYSSALSFYQPAKYPVQRTGILI